MAWTGRRCGSRPSHLEYGHLVDQQIRTAGMTPGEWFHRLDRLAYDLDAEAHDPVTCRRIREAHSRTMA